MKILLGVSGGIAAYKAPLIVRALRGLGHQVRCILTDNAQHLVAEAALTTLCEHPVERKLWPENGQITHIETVRWADCMVIAPATANVIGKCAHGIADDLLTTAYLAIEPEKPLFMAPAMNTVMWNKRVVQANIQILKGDGVHFIDPVGGMLACGEEGVGAMAAPEDIAHSVVELVG